MTAIEEMAGMDVLCSDKTGTLTLNKLTVDKNLVEVRFELYSLFSFLTRTFRNLSIHMHMLNSIFSLP